METTFLSGRTRRQLTAYAFAKDAHVNPGAIVENKLQGHTLRLMADAQRERDESRLDNQRMTLRAQDKLRRAMAAGFDGAGHEQKYRVNKPPTYSVSLSEVTVAGRYKISSAIGVWNSAGPRRGDRGTRPTRATWHTRNLAIHSAGATAQNAPTLRA